VKPFSFKKEKTLLEHYFFPFLQKEVGKMGRNNVPPNYRLESYY
jgi:hypothetical protein